MKRRSLRILLAAGLVLTLMTASAQNRYRYSIDLNAVNSDQLTVTLLPPSVKQKEITFYMPKIIPGTYRYADYGKFVHNFAAVDNKGKALPVKQLDTNSWKIEGADKLSKITYLIEDTWESTVEHDIYDMAGTNIEEKKNFVLNTPGVFGYFDGM